MNYWEIIADNLSKAGWSWGCVAAVDRDGRTIWIADGHRDDGQRFVVHADEILTAFLELERAVCIQLLSEQCRRTSRRREAASLPSAETVDHVRLNIYAYLAVNAKRLPGRDNVRAAVFIDAFDLGLKMFWRFGWKIDVLDFFLAIIAANVRLIRQ